MNSPPVTSWPSAQVLGVRVDDLPLQALLDSFGRVIQQRRKAVFANVNVHALNLAWKLPWLQDFFGECELVFCDGYGVRLGAWLSGGRLRHRNSVPDWLDRLCALCQTAGHSVYFLGAGPGVAEAAAGKLMTKFPRLNVAGTHHGYFDHHRGSQDNARIVAQINAASPDILIVAMGMPLQEAWIRNHLQVIRTHVVLPAGALLDYVSGRLRRPPAWLSQSGFEWLGRLILEPRRLWRRYLIGNPLFLWRVLRQRLGNVDG